jgi:hypothetical protein
MTALRLNCAKKAWALHVCCVPTAPKTPGVPRGMGHVVKNHAMEEERQQRLIPRTRR